MGYNVKKAEEKRIIFKKSSLETHFLFITS